MIHLNNRLFLTGLGLLACSATSAFAQSHDPLNFICGEGQSDVFSAVFSDDGWVKLTEFGTGNEMELPYSGESDDGFEVYASPDGAYEFGMRAESVDDAYVVVDGEVIYSGCWGGVACPYVYVHTADGPQYVGEILRYVIGKDRETTQTLALPSAVDADGTLRVRMTEEKPEISYLDEIRLLVDGRAVPADDCIAGELSWCERDGRYHQMSPGDVLELQFTVGVLPAGTSLELEATGYYEPLLQTVTR